MQILKKLCIRIQSMCHFAPLRINKHVIAIAVDGCPRNTPVALVWSALGEVRRGDAQNEPVFVETYYRSLVK